MNDFFDRLENRTPASRESALLRDLNHVVAVSRSRAPALRTQLKGIDVAKIRTRQDLASIPIRRRADMSLAQSELAPFGGFVATRIAALAQVFADEDGHFATTGNARDWWGMGRALYAAGLRKGQLLVNSMAYDLVPFGHMVESGARAIGCPVIPAGRAPTETVSAIVARLAPPFFCGPLEQLRGLLDHLADQHVPCSIGRALVLGALKPGPRAEFKLRGIDVRTAFALPETGIFAFESGDDDALTLAEGFLLEIVDPHNGRVVPAGSEGEIVLSRVNLDYPLLRYGTGLLSSVLPQGSVCGRTNTRIAMPRPQSEGLHIDVLRRRFPGLSMHLSNAQGRLHLQVEQSGQEPNLIAQLKDALKAVTSQSGTVELVQPGSLEFDASDKHSPD